MNKLFKIGGITFVTGLIIFLIAFGVSGFNIYKLNTQPKLEKKEFVSSSEINSITIDDYFDVTIKKSPDNKMHVSYFENKKLYYKISSGKDIVFKKIYNSKWYDGFFNFNYKHSPICVMLPDNFKGDIKIKTSNGNVKSNDIKVNNLEISTSNGFINLNSIDSKGIIKVKTSNGKITFNNVNAKKDINCSTSSGQIELINLNSDNIIGNSSNGKITYSNLNANNTITAKSSNHDIHVAQINAKKEINLETLNGDISGIIIGNLPDFSIKSKTSNGKNNLPEKLASGSKKLNVKTSNGNININFQNNTKTL